MALALLARPQSFGHLWGMRWVDVPLRVQPLVLLFGLALVAVALLAPPAMSLRRPVGRRPLRRAPLPRSLEWIAMVLCAAGVAMVCFPNSRTWADTNMWLALTGTALFSLGAPVVFAAATARTRHRAVSYIARQRARRGLTAVLLLVLMAFLATLAATHYAHYAKSQESWYRPFQPAGSLAVREVTDPSILAQLADANPGGEISIRSDGTGLLAVRPSSAPELEAAKQPIDEMSLVTADKTGLVIGQVGERAEVWTVDDSPNEHAALVDPDLIEDGKVVIGRLGEGRFVSLATISAVASTLVGGGGGFPDAVVDSLARFGGTPNKYRNLALLGFSTLSSAEQGRLEGLARSLAPAAFVEIDAGYQDGGLYAFSQLLGCGAALLVGLIALGFGLQLISEEREVRRLVVRSGHSRPRRRFAGMAAFVPVTLAIAFASLAALAFTRDTGDRSLPHYGYAPLAFLVAAVFVTVALGVVYARDPGR
ncbi:MAG: hypothetical protein JXA57_15625 [Armatimonadetes bacterium]|nr:hypothetical protein [Armatimonadota bacterium]